MVLHVRTVYAPDHCCAVVLAPPHFRRLRRRQNARIVLAIAESKKACRRHLIDPIPEVRHFFPNVAKYEEGPEERVTALLVTEENNVYYRHATRAPRERGDRAALVFNLDCVDLTEKEVQEPFKSAIS